MSVFRLDVLINLDGGEATKTEDQTDNNCDNPECGLRGILGVAAAEKDEARQNRDEDANGFELRQRFLGFVIHGQGELVPGGRWSRRRQYIIPMA